MKHGNPPEALQVGSLENLGIFFPVTLHDSTHALE